MTALIDEIEVERRLTNQPPRSELIHEVMDQLTASAIAFGKALIRYVPPGREQDKAMDALETTLFWAKKGIALHQEQVDTAAG